MLFPVRLDFTNTCAFFDTAITPSPSLASSEETCMGVLSVQVCGASATNRTPPLKDRLECHDRDCTASAVTRIRTWVVSATTRSTNHYTITAILPARPSACRALKWTCTGGGGIQLLHNRYAAKPRECACVAAKENAQESANVHTWPTATVRVGSGLARLQYVLPGSLVVRIRRSHRRGRGSIPRLGNFSLQ